MKAFGCIFVFMAGCAAGFFVVRSLFPTRGDVVSVEYIPGSPALSSVDIPKPVRIEVPALLSLPVRRDTVYVDSVIRVSEKVDTAAILPTTS
ncbi:MAG: hypothetical protein LBJ01_10990 [Tannerella sp.]|jgi:hypothetical protein|nr:hypothetical protein [Tannerella sp.]